MMLREVISNFCKFSPYSNVSFENSMKFPLMDIELSLVLTSFNRSGPKVKFPSFIMFKDSRS